MALTYMACGWALVDTLSLLDGLMVNLSGRLRRVYLDGRVGRKVACMHCHSLMVMQRNALYLVETHVPSP